MSGEIILNCIVCGAEVQADEQRCSQCREMENKVQVLTREERQHFSGITLEQDPQQEAGRYEYQTRNTNQKIYSKQFSISNTGLFTTLLFGIILAIIVVVALPFAIFLVSVISLTYYLMRK